MREARPQPGTGLQLIGSPVSREEMADLGDDAVAGLFDELPDATGTHHPDDWMIGGSVQLSQVFEEFAKAHPDRAVAVLSRLRPGEQERPAAHGVRGLVAAKRPASEITDLVERLDARGFVGHEFRETVAFALATSPAAGASRTLPAPSCTGGASPSGPTTTPTKTTARTPASRAGRRVFCGKSAATGSLRAGFPSSRP